LTRNYIQQTKPNLREFFETTIIKRRHKQIQIVGKHKVKKVHDCNLSCDIKVFDVSTTAIEATLATFDRNYPQYKGSHL